jgi:hypothetical protein
MDDIVSISALAGGGGTLVFAEGIGQPGKPVWLDLTSLVVDLRYQRAIDKNGWKNIRWICANFAWSKFEPIIAAPCEARPGKYAVIDGQHRAIAAFLHPQVDQVPAILHALDIQQQAQAFRDVNRAVTRLTPLQLYRAGILAGDPDAIAIKTVLDSAGVSLTKYAKPLDQMKPSECMCIASIRRALQAAGYEQVRTGLAALRTAGEQLAGGSLIAASSILVCAIAAEKLTEKELARVLVDTDLDQVRSEMLSRALNPSLWPKMAAGYLVNAAARVPRRA